MSFQAPLAEWIRSGPRAVETGMAQVITTAPDATSRYEQWITALQQSKGARADQAETAFLLGYAYQQAGKHCSMPEEKTRHYERALLQYESFLKGSGRRNPDARYFAQWQTGMIQQSLGIRWPAVEKSLLQTMECDPCRGEALKAIVVTRYTQQEWRIAHIYSSYCVEQLLGRPPENRSWEVDEEFYQWKMLKYHLPILVRLRKKEEAREGLVQLKSRVQRYAKSIDGKDRENIEALIQSMEEEL